LRTTFCTVLAAPLLLALVVPAPERRARCWLCERLRFEAADLVLVVPRDERDDVVARDPLAEAFVERVFCWLREFALLAIWSSPIGMLPALQSAYPLSGRVTRFAASSAQPGAFATELSAGITSVAISSSERFASDGSTQSTPQ
jgi:hypothetical protein